MKVLEAHGDLWDVHAQGSWIAITTNGVIRTNGHGVMGAGLAKQAADRFPRLPLLLGIHLRRFGIDSLHADHDPAHQTSFSHRV
mgnify:CR=1 FL=1